MSVQYLVFLISVNVWSISGQSAQGLQCESIRISMCMSMPWNLTQMPNLMGQSSQQNAMLKIGEYEPLGMSLNFAYCAFVFIYSSNLNLFMFWQFQFNICNNLRIISP